MSFLRHLRLHPWLFLRANTLRLLSSAIIVKTTGSYRNDYSIRQFKNKQKMERYLENCIPLALYLSDSMPELTDSGVYLDTQFCYNMDRSKGVAKRESVVANRQDDVFHPVPTRRQDLRSEYHCAGLFLCNGHQTKERRNDCAALDPWYSVVICLVPAATAWLFSLHGTSPHASPWISWQRPLWKVLTTNNHTTQGEQLCERNGII